MFTYHGVLRVECDVANTLGLGVRRHLDDVRVVSIQHGTIFGDLDDDSFHFSQLLQRIDAFHAEMIGLHIEHRTNVDKRHTHSRAQQATACDFENGNVDLRIGQHHARRHRPGHVTLYRPLTIDVHAIGCRQARRVAGHLGNVRQHARGGRLSIGAGDGGDRHARRCTGWKQHIDHRAGHVARRTFGRRNVHAKSRCGIDFAYATTDLLVALGDVGNQKIDAAHIETDSGNRPHGHVAIVGMDHVGHVGRRAASG